MNFCPTFHPTWLTALSNVATTKELCQHVMSFANWWKAVLMDSQGNIIGVVVVAWDLHWIVNYF